MADNEFQVESMGEVYAQALINEAQKQGVLEEVAEDVRGIGELLKTNKMFLSFTQALTIGEEERMTALEKIFGGTPPRVHPLTLNVIKSMARRDRLMFLRGLVEGFMAARKKMSGHVDVEVTSATEIGPGVLERLKKGLAGSVGGGIADVKVKVDPKLIGGMVVRIGDTQIDGSVATQLEKMEEQLKRGGQMKLESVTG
jgi:F-type H+-transporting ATPase subunit delta